MAQPFEGPMAMSPPPWEGSQKGQGTGGHLQGPVVEHSWDKGVRLWQALPCAPACPRHSCVQAAVVA